MLADRFASNALRVAVVLAIALVTTWLLRRGAPAARRLVLASALAGALVMPVVSAVAPAWRLPSPAVASVVHVREVTEPAYPAVRAVTSRVDVESLVAVVWLLGAGAVLARLVLGLARARALVHGSEAARTWSAAVLRGERVTGVRAHVRVSDEVGAPAVTGLLSPVVLVPRESERWSDDRRHAVLLHELAHVRQRDCFAQLVAQLACALHWFDPLVWVAARRLRLERELAADEAVLAAGARPSGYAEDLLAIASSTWAAGELASGALGMSGRSHLAARITAIVSGRRSPSPSRARAAAIVTACGVLVLAVACSAPTTTEPPVTASSATIAAAAPAPGAESTIRPALQAIADEELERALAESGGVAGVIVVLDPSTGEILADSGRDHGARADVAARSAYVTGSTMKPAVLAAALDDGILGAGEQIDCEGGSWTYQGGTIHDYHPFGTLSVPEMLAVSSNIGFAKVFDRMGGERLSYWLRAYHFGAAPPVEGAVAGSLPALEGKTSLGAVAVIGEVVKASPLQVAAVYATLANGGEYVAPTRARRSGAAARERIMKAETARTVVGMLEGVVYGERSTGKLARIDGVRVAGKTGTASWDLPGGGEGVYASFAGIVPSTSPRFVILVGVEQPKDGSGPSTAAPVFARVGSRMLAAR
jgi:beta-lactamase regulating signal transducer with metallopeptidase domain